MKKNEDEFGNAMASVFLGKCSLVSHYGTKPMSIKWELSEPMPPYIWKNTAKMAVG